MQQHLDTPDTQHAKASEREQSVERAPAMDRATEAAPQGVHFSDMTCSLGATPVQMSALDAALVQFRATVLQRSAASDTEGREERVQGAAARGMEGSGGALPFADRIQESFGHHDISGIRAHTGAQAQEATAEMGAHAYASGDSVVLGATGQDLHTVAHEAAHVIQQKGGVQLKGGVGQVGDRYEQHADAVADLVVQGKSAESLLDTMAGGATQSSAASGKVQMQEVKQPIADDATFQDLKASADAAEENFSYIVRNLVAETGASLDTLEKRKPEMVDNPEKKGTKVRRYVDSEHRASGQGPQKKQERADEKVQGKYDGKYNKVLDVLRATMAFKSFNDISFALGKIFEVANDLGYDIVRCKQTFDKKTATLYADIKVNIQEKETGHVCELQFAHMAMLEAKQKGHDAYKQLRKYDPLGEGVAAAHARWQKAEKNNDDNKVELKTAYQKVKQATVKSQEIYGPAHAKLQREKGLKECLDMVKQVEHWISSPTSPWKTVEDY